MNFFIILVKSSVFFLQNYIIHEDNALEYTEKNYAAKVGEVRLTGLAKGGGAVGEMLTLAGEGGRGRLDPPIFD